MTGQDFIMNDWDFQVEIFIMTGQDFHGNGDKLRFYHEELRLS